MAETPEKNRYLLKNTLIFALGNFGSKLITFLLVPLYTNTLSTSGYGVLDIINAIIMIGVPIVTLNISEAVMRFLLDKNSDKEKILGICCNFSLLAVVLSFLLYPIFNLFQEISSYSLLLSIYILVTAVSGISLCYIRGIEKILIFSIISIIKTLVIGIASIIFLVVFKLGINGYLLAYIIAETVTIFLCMFFGIKDYRIKLSKPDKELIKQMVKFSVFLIPNALMWWIINSMDRFMIVPFFGTEANGIYAVSAKIPTILVTITSIFNQAWMYSAIKEEKDKDINNNSDYTSNIYNVLFKFITLSSTLLIIILKPLLRIYVGKEFFSAWMYTPPLLVGSVFLTLGTFLSNEYTVHKDSKGFLRSASVGAIVNLVLNFMLMPIMGVLGAAIATCISYITVFIYRAYDIRKYKKIQYINNEKKIYLLVLILASIMVYINNQVFSLIVYTIFFIVTLGFFRKNILKLKRREIKNEK